MEINDSLTKLQVCPEISYSSLAEPSPKLTAALDTAVWQSEFMANNERDQAEILHYLSDIKNTTSIIAMTQHQQSTDIKAMMALMQQVREWYLSFLTSVPTFNPFAESLGHTRS